MCTIKKLIILILLLIPGILVAQKVEWASVVLEASSELGPREFSAEQALGIPNVTPGMGESPNAWMPYSQTDVEYIKVGFENSFKIRQIAIAESYNPSAISEIYIYDQADNEFLLNSFDAQEIDLESRMLHVFFDLTEFNVSAVKIVLNMQAVDGRTAIDAIGISDATIPIKQEVIITESAIVSVTPERLSAAVNSIYDELRPLITPDGKTLLFSRRNHPGNVGGINDPEDIWFSEWDEENETWKEAVNMGAPFNTPGPNFISSITPDGNTAILTLGNRYNKSGKMRAGVSMVSRNEEGWTEPISFEIINMINVSDKANFFLANNRQVMIMAIEDDPSFGDRDLYASFLLDDGRWSQPLNLGSDVNTAAEESAPFLAPDDKTLYFSSRGFTGYGGMDIYVTRRLDSTWTKWSTPENLGPLINSEMDDSFFNIPPTGEYGYFSRDFTVNNMDIYRFELPKEHKPEPVVRIKGVALDSKTKQPVSARIIYETLPDGKRIGNVQADEKTGEFEILLPTGSVYGYLAEAKDYVSLNANIDLTNVKEYQERNKDLMLVPIEKGELVRLNNIFFDFDKSELKPASFPELNRTVRLLEENPGLKIEIAGHTDNIGAAAYNQRLSELRAKAVENYLLNKGVEKDRLTSVGYGQDKPLVSNETEIDGREFNRRVEFLILEK
ncbi:MAG: OmpA family protein [Cyclobacteriaceae bacterium]